MQRGEVRWYPFAEPDKRRPVLILTRDSILDRLGEVTVAPITTRVRGIPTEVPLTPEDGLPHHCAINCDHLTVQWSSIDVQSDPDLSRCGARSGQLAVRCPASFPVKPLEPLRVREPEVQCEDS